MSEPFTWVDIDGLNAYPPRFKEASTYIRSTLEPLGDGPGGIAGGPEVYGGDDNGTKFSASFAVGAQELEERVYSWADSVDYTGTGVRTMAVAFDDNEDNNTRIANLPEITPPNVFLSGGGGGGGGDEPAAKPRRADGTVPLEAATYQPLRPAIPSVAPVHNGESVPTEASLRIASTPGVPPTGGT